jgi:putative chitinase
MMLTSVEQLMAATGCTKERATLYLPFLQGTMKAYAITSPRRMAGFLSQISHESAKLSQIQESLNYSVDGLLKTFGRHRISEADARRFGRAPGRPANQEAIANILYGGSWGARNLGNVMPGDGARFIGRGLKQLTGRDNYRRCGLAIGADFVMHPEHLLLPVNAALSAGWFWKTNGLNEIADRGDVRQMTRIVNGGSNGLPERTALYLQGLGVLA